MRGFSILRSGLLALILVGVPFASNAAEVVIKFATEAAGDHIIIECAEYMKREIQKRTSGKVEFQIFPGSQLGSQKAIMSGLRQGTHEMSLMASPIARLEPAYGVFEAPFLFSNHDEAKKVVKAVEADIRNRLLKKRIVLVAIGALGFRQISNNIRPIIKPDDLKGLKLRTPDNPFRISVFKGFGANPTPMSFAEVYMALRQGVIDGQENPLGSIWGAKFYEVQKYISISNHVFTPNSLVVSKYIWDKWPKYVQDMVQDIGTYIMEWSFQRDIERDNTLRAKMEKYSKFNNIDSAAFKKMAVPMYQELKETVGDEIWGKAMATLK